MLKKVILYTDPKESQCKEAKSFLEEHEVSLVIHDLRSSPLLRSDISRLLRHFNLKHFLNSQSKAYKKLKLDKNLPERAEVFDLIADDNDLLVKPIIVSGRLMMVGFNKAKIMEMLQIKSNGSDLKEKRYNSKNRFKEE